MYYYIFEPPQGPKEYERTAQIKEYLTQLGIAGEMAAPQPGRSAEDLVNLAIAKRYSTVVAVGGMDLVNRIARTLLPYEAVLGIIPTTNDADLAALIGTTDWKAAADQLKRRRWQHVELGIMNGTTCFLTPATITIPKGKSFEVQTEAFTLKSPGAALVKITPQRHAEGTSHELVLDVTSAEKPKSALARFFTPDSKAPQGSTMRVPALTLVTSEPLPVLVAGESLISTPIRCTTETKGLRLIVGKAGTA
jgi:hypothetical protein